MDDGAQRSTVKVINTRLQEEETASSAKHLTSEARSHEPMLTGLKRMPARVSKPQHGSATCHNHERSGCGTNKKRDLLQRFHAPYDSKQAQTRRHNSPGMGDSP